MKKTIQKTINLNLVGIDGNAYAIMGAFRRQAKKEGWTSDEIEAVIEEAGKSDYVHLLATIDIHCEPTNDE